MALYLSAYDKEWPNKFERERLFLLKKIEPWLYGEIEHVGSTAVANLLAKPTIDIMCGVKSSEDSQKSITILKMNGYCYFPYKKQTMHWFCKPSAEVRMHHLHLTPYQSTLWQERIYFRNLLRNNLELASEYANLKQTLAKNFLMTEKPIPKVSGH